MGHEVLPLPPYSPDLSPTDYHFFKHLNNFFQGKLFHNQQEAENAFQELIKSRSRDIYATEINRFLIGENVLIEMVPILFNKGMFEPSYTVVLEKTLESPLDCKEIQPVPPKGD